MKDYLSHCLKENATILEAIKKINELSDNWTLLITNEENKMVGTLTDGDIRRGFIRGLTLVDVVSSFMSTEFKAIKTGFTIFNFKKNKDLGIKLLPVLDNNGQIIKVYNLDKIKSILPIECMIMAGGRGERLRPLTDTKPKPMLPLGGKPIIEHNIDRLINYGIEKFYISVNYLGSQIVDYLGDGSSKGISIEYIWEDKPLGTAGALSLVENFNTEHILLMNGDLFTDADFEDLYLNFIEKKADLVVASVSHNVKVPYGIFSEKDKYVIGLREKPIFTNYANAGIYILKKQLIQQIPNNTFFNMTDLMNLMIQNKQILIHNPIIGFWIDIGQPQDYLNAQEIAKQFRNGNS